MKFVPSCQNSTERLSRASKFVYRNQHTSRVSSGSDHMGVMGVATFLSPELVEEPLARDVESVRRLDGVIS